MSESIEKNIESTESSEEQDPMTIEAPKPKRVMSEAAKQKGAENLAKGRELLRLKKQKEKEEKELLAKELKKKHDITNKNNKIHL